MSPKMGRPPLPEDERKVERLEIRLTTDEKEFLTELAEKMGISRTEVIMNGIRLLAKKQR